MRLSDWYVHPCHGQKFASCVLAAGQPREGTAECVTRVLPYFPGWFCAAALGPSLLQQSYLLVYERAGVNLLCVCLHSFRRTFDCGCRHSV